MASQYIKAEQMARKSVQQGLITRFQVAEYLKEYAQYTGMHLDFSTSCSPKEFLHQWNSAKRRDVQRYKQRQAQEQRYRTATSVASKMPIELLLAVEFRRLSGD